MFEQTVSRCVLVYALCYNILSKFESAICTCKYLKLKQHQFSSEHIHILNGVVSTTCIGFSEPLVNSKQDVYSYYEFLRDLVGGDATITVLHPPLPNSHSNAYIIWNSFFIIVWYLHAAQLSASILISILIFVDRLVCGT